MILCIINLKQYFIVQIIILKKILGCGEGGVVLMLLLYTIEENIIGVPKVRIIFGVLYNFVVVIVGRAITIESAMGERSKEIIQKINQRVIRTIALKGRIEKIAITILEILIIGKHHNYFTFWVNQ